MTRMRIRDLASCRDHHRALVILEDEAGARRLTFYAAMDETLRLAQTLRRRSQCHPIYDFIRALFATCGVTATRVVIEDRDGHGLGASVHLRHDEQEAVVACYPPDALALAVREQLPIYATAAALDHAVSVPPADVHSDATAQWLRRVRPEDFRE